MSTPRDLNGREALFVEEYMKDLDSKRAAIAAGYSRSTARSKAHQWVGNSVSKPHVYFAVQRRIAAKAAKIEATADRTLVELAYSAFLDPGELFDDNGKLIPIKQMPEHVRRAIASVKVRLERSGEYDDAGKPVMDNVVEIKLNDKTRNLELIGRHLKMFKDALDVHVLIRNLSDAELQAAKLEAARTILIEAGESV